MELELKVGDKIKIGKEYAKNHGFEDGEIITLIEGEFEEWNGLYNVTQTAPAIWNSDQGDFDSIYHLFGNDLEDFKDCELIN